MGLSYKERGFGAGNISAVILGAAGVVTIAGVIRNKIVLDRTGPCMPKARKQK